MSNQTQVGTVHEVKGTAAHEHGKDKDARTSRRRGSTLATCAAARGSRLSKARCRCSRRRRHRAGIIMPAPNKKFKTPEHADGSGQDEESYQLADYREKQTKDGYDNWLQPDEEEKQENQQSQQGGQGGESSGGGKKQQKKGHVGGDKAVMKHRMNKDTGHTLRVGKDSRVAANKDGAKIRMSSDYVVVTKGKIILSKPPIIGRT
jgi:hypothetical protein